MFGESPSPFGGEKTRNLFRADKKSLNVDDVDFGENGLEELDKLNDEELPASDTGTKLE